MPVVRPPAPPSKRPFTYPLPEEALDEFTHPDPAELLHLPYLLGNGAVLAADGHVAVRVQRGFFAAEDFPAAPAEVLERIGTLPWHLIARCRERGDWLPLDDVRGDLYDGPVLPRLTRGESGRWHPPHAPTVRIGGGPVVPLPLLQLIARLPRVELLVRDLTVYDPVLFRFSGGSGCIGHHRHLTLVPADRQLFHPLTHPGHLF